MKKMLVICLVALPCIFMIFDIAKASDFDAEQQLLAKKIGLCEASIKIQKCATTKYCKDLSSYSDYLMKGSSTAYIEYHLQAGDINNKNEKLVLSNMEKELKILNQVNSGTLNCD